MPRKKHLSPADQPSAVSVTELFTIGIGPSSSHTVGPMRAAKAFAAEMVDAGLAPVRVQCELFGSLSLTGRGHHSDRAVLLGLSGETPETVDPEAVEGLIAAIGAEARLALDGRLPIPFDIAGDLLFRPGFLPGHPNAMVFTATLPDGSEVPNGAHLDGYAQFNLSASHHFAGPNLDVRFDVINVLDHVYEIRDGGGVGVGAPQYGPRRGFFVGLTKTFGA